MSIDLTRLGIVAAKAKSTIGDQWFYFPETSLGQTSAQLPVTMISHPYFDAVIYLSQRALPTQKMN